MKNSLKVFALVLAVTLAFCALATFSACGETVGTGGRVTVIFTDAEGQVVSEITRNTKAEFLIDFMTELKNAEDIQTLISEPVDIDFVTQTGAYGTTVDSYSVNGITYGDWNKSAYVMLYTSITDAKYIAAGYSKEIGGVTYNSCGYGADGMPVLDGVTYVFTVEIWA